MTTEFQIGQWVRSLPVGTARAFVGQVVGRVSENYVIRDDWKRRFERKAEQLETLQ